jgi:hypothetical protein
MYLKGNEFARCSDIRRKKSHVYALNKQNPNLPISAPE